MTLQLSNASLPFIHQGKARRGSVRARSSAAVGIEKAGTEVEKVKVGGSELKVTKLGIGAWSWGDTSYWNNFEWDGSVFFCWFSIESINPTFGSSFDFQRVKSIYMSDSYAPYNGEQPFSSCFTLFHFEDRKMKAAKAAFNASVDEGITFFDTAELYGSRVIFGAVNSETLLGRFIEERKKVDSIEIDVATKFAALPWRLGRESVVAALNDSLCRLGLSSVELYQLHWQGIWGNKGYIDGLGDAVEKGLVKAVGVSNYSEKRLREAYDQLKKRGIPLASNQVNYSLLYRLPEENGVKATCDELGITLIAYSPIAQGALIGKYTPANPPSGPRGRIYTPEFLTTIQPLLGRIKEIGQRYEKTPTQVVLNWLIAQDNVIPIPGARNAEQAKEFAGAVGWRLSNEEVAELRSLASEIKPVIGFPVEKL